MPIGYCPLQTLEPAMKKFEEGREVPIEHQLQSTREKAAKAAQTNEVSDTDFREIVSDGKRLLGMSDENIADELLQSVPAVGRWQRGKNLPHRLMRPGIVTWVSEKLGAQLDPA